MKIAVIVLLALAVLLLGVIAVTGLVGASSSPSEIKINRSWTLSDNAFEIISRAHYREGWRLASVTSHGGQLVAVWER